MFWLRFLDRFHSAFRHLGVYEPLLVIIIIKVVALFLFFAEDFIMIGIHYNIIGFRLLGWRERYANINTRQRQAPCARRDR
jgi:hypothetical protein